MTQADLFSYRGQDRCPHCGASMKMYWHTLTPLLVETLVEFYKAVSEKGENRVHVPKEVELTKTQYNNFQKLRFHGLVAKVKDDGVHTAGYWLLTKRGKDFLRNELAIPKRVQTFRNKVVDHDTQLVSVADVIGSIPYVETEFVFNLFGGIYE